MLGLSTLNFNLVVEIFVLMLSFYEKYQTFYVALAQKISGLKEYISANPSLILESATTVVKSKFAHASIPNGQNEENEAQDEFYDAIAGTSSSSDEDSDNEELNQKVFQFFYIWSKYVASVSALMLINK